jgi:hypothetical protein
MLSLRRIEEPPGTETFEIPAMPAAPGSRIAVF